jgi:RNA polymerase sigma-70 factor (ECF subfamily)
MGEVGGDFDALIEPYREELRRHCYRMLGSLQDAEDAVQETLLAAWRGYTGFHGDASLRTWLYRIATNTCLNARRSASRRPAKAWDIPGVSPPEPTRSGEVVWLEPYPVERAEDISLAFVTALQTLPPRQVAVLILRDVLGFSAREVAEQLDASVQSVNSALKRARAGLPERPAAVSPDAEAALAAEFARAYEAADVDAVVALLTDDVFISMPPIPYEYVGRDLAARFIGALFGGGRRFKLVPTRANGQPAFATYVGGVGAGLFVLTLDGDGISALTRFEAGVLDAFAMPSRLGSPP